MKKIFTVAALLLLGFSVQAQTPQKYKAQAEIMPAPAYQFIDRIVKPCAAGAVPLASVIVNPLNVNTIAVTTCTGGTFTVNGVAPGAGTVTVVGAGTLTSTAIVTGGGAQTVQTPSATSTLDSSGNMVLGGSTLKISGTTSASPMLKRNATAINFRLADDSADAGITAAGATFSGSILNSIDGTNTIGGTAANRFLINGFGLSIGAGAAVGGESRVASGTSMIRQVASGQLVLGSAVRLGWSSGDPSAAADDVTISRNAAGIVQVGTTAANSAGTIKALAYTTDTNCADSAGAAACGSASAGHVVIDAGSTSVVVSTTSVTANSQITPTFDSSLGTRLGITCNTTIALPAITARTAGTSFTITIAVAPITNPACFGYEIKN